MCKFGENVTVLGQLLNSSQVRCNFTTDELTFFTATGQETRAFELQLTRGKKEYTLDTSTGGIINGEVKRLYYCSSLSSDLTVTLYQCSTLAKNCSSCVTQSTDFQCKWCGEDSTCIDAVEALCNSMSVNITEDCTLPANVDSIVGGLVGGLVLLLALLLIFACMWKKMSAKSKEVVNLQVQLQMATQPVYT